jgi:serine/threonine-protein kinase
LNREKQLPVDDALQIAREVADALGSAHKHDVIHRDIKPENILLEEGHAVVADFGIARAVDVAGGTKLTETGIALGTPHYMSPEQAAGGRDLDGRSDIYSLGCVLYEMLGGQPPFTGVTVESVIHQHIGAKPSPVTEVREAVPSEVAHIIDRMLAKTPADRFATAGQFSEALIGVETAPAVGTWPVVGRERLHRKVIAYAAIAILTIIGAYTVISRTSGHSSELAVAAETPKLAVLPFNNLGSSESEYFADGITEEMTSRIAEISGLRVISRQSAIQYKDSEKTLQQIGEELSVDYILEGTIRTDRVPDGSGQVRVTPQLIRVSDDANLWTDRYTASLVPGEIFGIQEQIANRVAQALDVTLLEPERRRLAAKPTENSEAYDLYLRGQDYLARPGYREANWSIAEDLLTRAIELDPEFALARAKLSFLHGRTYFFSYDLSQERLVAHEREAREALRLQPDMPEAHFAQGYVHYVRGDLRAALKEFRIAQEAAPSDALTSERMGYAYRRLGDWDAWERAYARTVQLNPRNVDVYRNLGAATLRFLRRHEEAVQALDRALELAPDFTMASILRGFAIVEWTGDREPLRAVLDGLPPGEALGSRMRLAMLDRDPDRIREIVELGPEVIEEQMWVMPMSLNAAWAHRLRGDERASRMAFDSARVLLESLLADAKDFRVHLALGYTYAGLGRVAEAVQSARRYLDEAPQSAGDVFFRNTLHHSEASVLAQAGMADHALDLLDRLLGGPSMLTVPLLRLNPMWDPIRDNPRFQALLEKYEN